MHMRNLIILLFLFISVTAIQGQDFTQTGIASYYADKFEGRVTASGEKYRHSKLTAAHRTLQFGTKVKVINLENQKTVVVIINDRGPFVQDRIIDLSKTAAEQLDFIHAGLAEVRIEILDAAASNTVRGSIPVNPGSDIEPDEKIYYKVQAEKITPKGYSVQIGSFEEMANLIKLTDALNSSYRSKVTIKVVHINNKKLYQVLVGQEDTRKKAERIKDKLTNKYPNSFIVKF